MRLADPRTPYEVLASPSGIPFSGSIGIYATGGSIWVRQTVRGGRETVRQIASGPAAGIYGPTRERSNIVIDGDFEAPLAPAWTVQASPVARVQRASGGPIGDRNALRVVGTGHRSDGLSTTVTQTVASAAPAPRGTEYLIGLLARASGLSRPVSVELRLDYRDGSYQFFLGTSWQRGVVVDGTPDGTTRGWTPITIRAVAAKAVRSATLFTVDTGSQPLRGTLWLDEVGLQRS
jgi:hypothetical protein